MARILQNTMLMCNRMGRTPLCATVHSKITWLHRAKASVTATSMLAISTRHGCPCTPRACLHACRYYLQSRRVRAEMIAAMDGTSAADRAGRDSANTDRAPARWANPYVPPADGQMYRIVA